MSTSPTAILFPPPQFPYFFDLLCRICFHFGNGCLLTPSLRLLSQTSPLLCVSPTSDRSSGSLRLQDFNCPYLAEPARPPRYTDTTFVRSPRSLTPTKPTIISHNDYHIAACDQEEGIGFRSILLTGLYRFTLSHCGSRTPLPTLKPHLTASASRLCTDCLLCFIGFGFSPNCIICTELAHPPCYIIAYRAMFFNQPDMEFWQLPVARLAHSAPQRKIQP